MRRAHGDRLKIAFITKVHEKSAAALRARAILMARLTGSNSLERGEELLRDDVVQDPPRNLHIVTSGFPLTVEAEDRLIEFLTARD